jgi:hypothetical protein
MPTESITKPLFMKTKILLFCFPLTVITAFSQDSLFQLKDYKYRTPGYRALEVSVSFNGNTTNDKSSGVEAHKQHLFQLYPSSITYWRNFSTEKRWHTSTVLFSSYFLSDKETTASGSVKGKNLQAAVDWRSEDRFYKRDNWFFQLGNSLYAKEDYTKGWGLSDQHNTNVLSVNETPLIGLGKGRVEWVQDAQMALFILNDLAQQGLLNTMPDAELTNQFAQLITEINNRRVFDFRKKRIYQLTSIEKFLREKGITPSTDIRHFTIIDDNWTLALNPYRLSGSYWYFQLQPSAEFGKSNQTVEYLSSKTIYEARSYILGAGPNAGYENDKPINLKWQRNMGTSLAWKRERIQQNNKNIQNGTTQENKTGLTQTETSFDAFYGIGFYPNNRTRLDVSLDLRAWQLLYNIGVTKKQTSVEPAINFVTDYFINYRTRLLASFFLAYKNEHFKYISLPSSTQRSLNTSFSLSVSHAFL